MAITTTINSNTLTLRLDNGRDEQGRQKYVNVNITNIKQEAFSNEDMQKAINIVNALTDIFSHTVMDTRLTTRYTIAQSA